MHIVCIYMVHICTYIFILENKKTRRRQKSLHIATTYLTVDIMCSSFSIMHIQEIIPYVLFAFIYLNSA